MWNVGVSPPDTTEFLQGRQLVVVKGGTAALRPKREALDGLYPRGLVTIAPWRANNCVSLTLWLRHEPGWPVACLYFLRKNQKPQDSSVLHLPVGQEQHCPKVLPVLSAVCECLKLLEQVEPLSKAAVVLPPSFLPRYILEGARDSQDPSAARLTRLLHETDLLGKTFTTPKKVPQRWGLQLGFTPSLLPLPWGCMFRTADFHRAQYFTEPVSAALIALRPGLL